MLRNQKLGKKEEEFVFFLGDELPTLEAKRWRDPCAADPGPRIAPEENFQKCVPVS